MYDAEAVAYDYNGSSITQKWKFLRGSQALEDGHQIRILDVDGNGKINVVELQGTTGAAPATDPPRTRWTAPRKISPPGRPTNEPTTSISAVIPRASAG